MDSRFPVLPAILSGDTADVYFVRTKSILESEQRNPLVTMEIFGSGPGLVCGISEALELLRTVLPTGADLWAVEEGTAVVAKEVVLRIKSPYLSFGLYETALLGTLASCTGWATAAQACVQAAQGRPVISFGARHVHPKIAATMDRPLFFRSPH